MPGKTTWLEAKRILSSVTEIKTNYSDIFEWQKRKDIYIRGWIISDNMRLTDEIIVDIQKPAFTYRVDRILEQYGSPERVFIETAYHGVMDPYNIYFALTLAYPQQKFIIQYVWMATRSGENTVACIQDRSTLLSINAEMNSQWADSQIIENIYGSSDDTQYVKPLEEVTDLTIAKFTEEFKSISGDECIATPGKYWP